MEESKRGILEGIKVKCRADTINDFLEMVTIMEIRLLATPLTAFSTMEINAA